MELSWKFLENGSLYVEDPVYKTPYVLPPHIAGMFKTKEMERLQKIKQTDYSYIEYPGLEKDKRWRHSMGVAHLGYELFEKFSRGVFAEYGIEIDSMEREIAECVLAAHDIGHLDNSHHSERLIKYSHELRTVDILLGDTEVGRYLRSKYPEDKVEEVVLMIAKINNKEVIEKSKLSPLMQLYSQVVSSSYDIDKIDYTLGDSYCAGIPTGVEPMELLNGFSVTLDNNGDMRLAIKEKVQRQGERLQIERFQNYRDMYWNIPSELMDRIVPKIYQLVEEEPQEVKNMLPAIFLKKVEAGMADRRITTLEEELQMVDDITDISYEILTKHARNPVLRYLCDIKTLARDTKTFHVNNNVQEYFKKHLQELQAMFPNADLSDTKSLTYSDVICELKRSSEDFLVESDNGEIVSIEEKEGSVIKPQVFHIRRIYFNPELLRLELGLSKEEFKQYKLQMDNFIDNLGERTEEFQARYTLEDKSVKQEDIIHMLKEHGFSLVGTSNDRNIDDYYDTRNLDLLKQGKELRGRTGRSGKISAMYKEPVEGDSKSYTFRKVFEVSTGVKDTSLEAVKSALTPRVGELATIPLENKPMIHADTGRTKMYFVRNGKAICVAWDETLYHNKWFGKQAPDVMIEIQNRRGTSKLILKTIDQIFDKYPEKFRKCKMSKVLRGVNLTRLQKEQPENDSHSIEQEDSHIEREKKIKFLEQDRKKIESLLPEILSELGFEAETQEFDLSDQMDYYFDTPSLYYGKSKGEPSLRTREKASGKLETTYKVPEASNGDIAEREEKEGAKPKSTSVEDFKKSMQERGISIYPDNLELATKVDNHRKKMTFYRSGMKIELAIDDVTNINPKTDKRVKSKKGEFELEIKEAQMPVEKQREVLDRIWQAILQRCNQQGIALFPSEHNKYVSSLLELGLLREREQEEI